MADDDEIEELLKAAQDELILKLSVDSHTSRSHPDYLDPDLHSRFLALKSLNNKDPKRRPTNSKVVEDDLMLRFAALKKTTLPSSSSSVHLPDQIGEEVGEDAQVEKLIQWAIDAARLDPSPPSDDDHNQSSDDDSTKDVKP